jgi:uncharacterized protein (TIRG00374 family)
MNLKILRFLLAGGILAYVLSRVGVVDVFHQLKDLNIWYGILFIGISYPMIWASCKKWRLFIPEVGAIPPMNLLMRYYTISYFANLFLPSTLGGDAARSLKLGRYLNSQLEAFVATFLERLSGLLAMILFAVSVLVLKPDFLVEFTLPVLFIAAGVIMLSGLFLTRSGGMVLHFIVQKIRSLPLKSVRIMHHLDAALSKDLFSRVGEKLFWKALLWSFVFHGLTVLNTYLAALSIGWDTVSFFQLCVVVPLVLLLSMIPITPGGIGIQEGAFVYLLSSIGGSPSEALSVALLLRMKTLLLGLIGAYFMFTKEEISSQKMP